MGEFKVNDYITLKLEPDRNKDLKTMIYVNGEKFNQCKGVIIQIAVKEMEQYKKLKSIDNFFEFENPVDTYFLFDDQVKIPPEWEFWGHCSNLQAWVEHDYDTRIIDSALAFPLLQKLSEVGDPLATILLKEEIARRYISNDENVQEFLYWEGYLEVLKTEEIQALLRSNQEVITELEALMRKRLKLMPYRGQHGPGLTIKDGEIISLDLERCELKEFPAQLRKLKSLRKLNLSCNEIKKLPGWLGSLSSLEDFEMEENRLTSLPESIGELGMLKRLRLDSNKISSLPESIGRLKSIDNLGLARNKLKQLPDSIGNLKTIGFSMNLMNNQLTALPESIGRLESLRYLELRGNKISYLPESIGELKNLKEFNLDRNPLKEIPKSIVKCVSLKQLGISFTEIEIIPEFMTEIPSLEILAVHGVKAEIPTRFVNKHTKKEIEILSKIRS